MLGRVASWYYLPTLGTVIFTATCTQKVRSGENMFLRKKPDCFNLTVPAHLITKHRAVLGPASTGSS